MLLALPALESSYMMSGRNDGINRDRPEVKKLFMQLDPVLVRFEGDRLRISVKPRKFLYIQLKFGDYQRKFIEEWICGKLRVGEISINENKVLIPFRKDVDFSNPDDWIAIDFNESNFTVASYNPHILRIENSFRTIHTTYFNIIRGIQKLGKFKPKTAERLLKKYSGREKRRAMDECHKISKRIVDFAKQHKTGVIMEDLKGIRRRISYNKNLIADCTAGTLESFSFTSNIKPN
ncbi:MAG: hypothetical protein QFX40_03185 [Archaeoglobales archaeon]|nr:hypothetical protein [Archaeoglobales archaeon]